MILLRDFKGWRPNYNQSCATANNWDNDPVVYAEDMSAMGDNKGVNIGHIVANQRLMDSGYENSWWYHFINNDQIRS